MSGPVAWVKLKQQFYFSISIMLREFWNIEYWNMFERSK